MLPGVDGLMQFLIFHTLNFLAYITALIIDDNILGAWGSVVVKALRY